MPTWSGARRSLGVAEVRPASLQRQSPSCKFPKSHRISSGKGMQELLGHTSWACATFPTQSQASLVALKAQHGSANQCLSHPTSGGPLCPATVPPPRSRGAYPVWLNPVSHISSVPHDAWSDVPSPILRDHKVTLFPAPGTNVSAQARRCTTETLVRPAALGQKDGPEKWASRALCLCPAPGCLVPSVAESLDHV